MIAILFKNPWMCATINGASKIKFSNLNCLLISNHFLQFWFMDTKQLALPLGSGQMNTLLGKFSNPINGVQMVFPLRVAVSLINGRHEVGIVIVVIPPNCNIL